jgi:hypothetical protein
MPPLGIVGVAYGSLLQERRRALHTAAGRTRMAQGLTAARLGAPRTLWHARPGGCAGFLQQQMSTASCLVLTQAAIVYWQITESDRVLCTGDPLRGVGGIGYIPPIPIP